MRILYPEDNPFRTDCESKYAEFLSKREALVAANATTQAAPKTSKKSEETTTRRRRRR